jgi:hypothetical protein
MGLEQSTFVRTDVKEAKLATTSSVFVIFATDGEVLEALVRCIGVVMVSCRHLEVHHASPDADRPSTT